MGGTHIGRDVFEPVADAAYGDDEGGAAWVILDFVSEVSDVDVHGLWDAAAVACPSRLNDSIAAEDVFGATGKRVKDVKLDSGKFNRGTVFPNAPFARIQSQATKTQGSFPRQVGSGPVASQYPSCQIDETYHVTHRIERDPPFVRDVLQGPLAVFALCYGGLQCGDRSLQIRHLGLKLRLRFVRVRHPGLLPL